MSQSGEPLEKLFMAGSSEAEDVRVLNVRPVKIWSINIPKEPAQWLPAEPSAGGTGATSVEQRVDEDTAGSAEGKSSFRMRACSNGIGVAKNVEILIVEAED